MSGKKSNTKKTASTVRKIDSRLVGDSNDRLRAAEKRNEKNLDTDKTEQIVRQTIYKTIETRQLDDPFSELYRQSATTGAYLLPIEPPTNPEVLKSLPMENNILNQCIEAMVLNIEGTGHTFEYVGVIAQEESPEVKAELKRLEAFVSAVNEEYSLVELRRRIRRDKETFGYAFIEIVRDTANIVHAIYHIPAHTMRLTAHDPIAVDIPYDVNRNGKNTKIFRHKRFRRFVQRDFMQAKSVYFKEFGDPRRINLQSGLVDMECSEDMLATEVLMFSDYKSGYLYGHPRWINQIPSILGSRESELVNLEFFRDNAIPAMAVMVAGGYLSQDSVDAIGDKFQRKRGRRKMHEVLILEATGDDHASSPDGQMPVPRMELKPLVSDRQKDALFQNYDKECQRKVRSAFRLPPIMLGMSDDYTYATADASMVVCESQVFQPERSEVDELFNRYFLGDGVNPPKFWRFKSNPTRLVDKKDIADSITVLDQVGALTPNVAIGIANQLFNLSIKRVSHEWGDYPYTMVIELIKQGREVKGIEKLVQPLPDISTEDQSAPQNSDNQDTINVKNIIQKNHENIKKALVETRNS